MDTGHVPTTEASTTAGVDLSSQAAGTTACRIRWDAGGASAAGAFPPDQPLDDAALLELLREVDVGKVGIDAPLGWPLGWIDALAGYRDHTTWPALDTSALRFRATDYAVKEAGKNPMSVATDDLVWPTIRCARLLASVGDGKPVDRSGAGRVAEVYPGAALKRFGLLPADTPITEWRYKEPARPKDPDAQAGPRRDNRIYMLDRIGQGLPGLELDAAFREQCEVDDDPFDALVCALVARAVDLGLCDPIPLANRWQATREGGIHLPHEGSLSQLA